MIAAQATRVAPGLTELAKTIDVSADGLSARVQSEEITGDNPRGVARELGTMLYHIAHVGRMEPIKTRPRSYRDPQLEAQLHDATPHRTTRRWAQTAGADGCDDDVVLALDGVRVKLPAGTTVDAAARQATARVRVEIPACRPTLSPGFFLADGSAGTGDGTETLRLYVGLTEVGAAAPAWNIVLGALENLRVPYRAKISSSPHLFPRHDALVVYLKSAAWPAVPDIVTAALTVPGRTDGVSDFAHRLGPGVAAAWEPQDARPVGRGLSFGEHRSQALAEAVVRAATGAAPDVGSAIRETFVNASIDPGNPARNLASPRIAMQ